MPQQTVDTSTTGDTIREGFVKVSGNATDAEGRLASGENHAGRKDNPHGVTAAQAGAVPIAEKGVANGVTPLDSSTEPKIPTIYLPPLATTEVYPVNSETEMLALDCQRGDEAIRLDTNTTYVLAAEPTSTLSNWMLRRTPTDAVQSVNGQVGVVQLGAADVGAASAQAVGSFHAYGTTDQVDIPSARFTKVLFPSEEADISGWYDAANSRYAPQRAGYYGLNAALEIGPSVSGKRVYISLFRNGSRYKDLVSSHTASASNIQISGSARGVYANGTTDYFEAFVWHDFGVSTSDILARQISTYFSGGFEGTA